MRLNHRVYYTVTNFEGFWYQRGKWITKDKLDKKYDACNNYYCTTFKQARRSANKCPAKETIVVKRFIKHGKPLEREYTFYWKSHDEL